jgi:hypothetical protein
MGTFYLETSVFDFGCNKNVSDKILRAAIVTDIKTRH